MTLKKLVILILIGTFLMWSGWAWALFSIDPLQTNSIGFLLFFGSLYLALTGTIALAGLWIRRKNQSQQIVFHTVSQSFRQGCILSALFVIILMLQGFRVLRVWNILLLLAVAIIVEAFILYKKHRPEAEVKFEISQVDDYVPPAPAFTKREINQD